MDSLVVVLILVFVAAIWFVRRRHAWVLRRLAKDGELSQATVTRRVRLRRPKGLTRTFIDYAFETVDGRRFEGRTPATSEEYRQHTVGSHLQVIYDRQLPSLNRTRAYLIRKGYMQV